MKMLIVAGARPNFMKVAPILSAIKAHNSGIPKASRGSEPDGSRNTVHAMLVHTGQHYSELMSDAFFDDLQLSKPDVSLGVGSGTHAVQTAEVMKRFEEVLLREHPDVVVVVGDVNSTLACALVTAKISLSAQGDRPLLAHVEAGLRSFDRTMPEEVNRILTDQLSDLLFVTEESGVLNLRREGIPNEKVHFVGNTMIDSLLAFKERAESSTILSDLGLPNANGAGPSGTGIASYAVLTLHRPANVDHQVAFKEILEGLGELAQKCLVLFPAHPRTQKRICELGLEHYFVRGRDGIGAKHRGGETPRSGILLLEPLRYLDFLCLMKNARLVLTDSGGIQEETTCLGIPCVTVRENTERPVTLTSGTNFLGGVNRDGIRRAIGKQLGRQSAIHTPDLWDGKSAPRILAAICREHEKRNLICSSACN